MTDNPRIQLRRLATLEPRSKASLVGVLENLDTICSAALGQRRRYVSKHGESIDYEAPDFSIAVKAHELGAKLLALTDLEAIRPSDGEMIETSIPLLERYLAKAGYALVPLNAESTKHSEPTGVDDGNKGAEVSM